MAFSKNLNETALFKKLNDYSSIHEITEQDQRNITKLISLINDISEESSHLMKTTIKQFEEYTLHDEIHSINVINLMGKILEESSSINFLSYIEISVLILSAYLHDIGMVTITDELEKIVKSDDFNLFNMAKKRESKSFIDLKDINLENMDIEKINSNNRTIEQSILTEYIRKNHGDIGTKYIENKWGADDRWVIEYVNISEIVGIVCKGHNLHLSQLTYEFKDEYPIDSKIGDEYVNILYLTIILRLADILDFDRKRTPNVLFNALSIENDISINEWNKHMSVEGWHISSENIRFECKCYDPVYEKTIKLFMDQIDNELKYSLAIVNDFPDRENISNKYKLKLPILVDRSKIRSVEYEYMDLEFNLSHDEIIKLLMGTDLWGGNQLCIRELIQNSYDAIRHRRAIEKSQGVDWQEGKITLIQRVDSDGRLEVICKDNGRGMDKNILENYFFRVGRSYYQSVEFERELVGLKSKNAYFDPISQFGIGVISTFMIGDSLKILTQKYLGHNKGCGPKLEINVRGISELIVLKNISDESSDPGTEIIITGKKLSDEEIMDDNFDPLGLTGAAHYYARALDIPIEVIVESPFNPSNFIIEPLKRPLRLKTPAEKYVDSNKLIILEKNFNELNKELEGTIRIPFLKDNNNKITLENDAGKWCLDKERNIVFSNFRTGKRTGYMSERSLLCQDGIIVSGHLESSWRFGYRGSIYNAPEIGYFDSYFLNLTGNQKLPLKVNRAPYDTSVMQRNDNDFIWSNFFRKVRKFRDKGFLSEILNEDLMLFPEDFWKIIEIYDFSPYYLDKNIVFKKIKFPCVLNSEFKWMSLDDIYKKGIEYISLDLPIDENNNVIYIIFKNCQTVFKKYGHDFWPLKEFNFKLRSLILSNTKLVLKNGEISHKIDMNSFTKYVDDLIYLEPMNSFLYQIYDEELNEYLYVYNELKGINYCHPIIKFYRDNNEKNGFEWFIRGLKTLIRLFTNDDNIGLLFDEYINWNEDIQSDISYIMYSWDKFNWDLLTEELKPPYYAYHPVLDKKFEINPEKFESIIKKLNIKRDIRRPRKLKNWD